MTSNLTIDGSSVAPPTEDTVLLPPEASSTTSPYSTNSVSSETQRQLWEELERPWPSTFERSIALLASPILQVKDAALYTKSPKPGSTAIALARRSNLVRVGMADAALGDRERHRVDGSCVIRPIAFAH